MIVFPNAKINIGLDIVRRRPDGYHDISTVMYPIPWRDVLEIVPSRSGEMTLTVTGNKVDCPVEKNLVMKAARLLSTVAEVPASDIYLHKIIPDGAGMGGGSADAAFTLALLNEMYDIGKSKDELAGLALKLGADCPFFIYNTPMLAEGTGEKLSRITLDLSGHVIVVVKPSFSISTAEAYGGVTPCEPEVHLLNRLSESVSSWRGSVKNDFVGHLSEKYTAIGDITLMLYETGAEYASMTGSGSAVFGIFEPACSIEALKSTVENECTGCQILVDRL